MTIYKERVAKLVAALRSGAYKQEIGVLHLEDAYCVLGVACEISNLGRWEGAGGSPQGYRIEGLSSGGNPYGPPPKVMDYYGWSTPGADLTVPLDGRPTSLADLNDSGFTFEEIADLIEAGLVEEGGRS